ncbi:glycine betaine/proline transport system substrate-binding protein [Acidocella aminolytica 101 = DSM 11237]|jgi:glycine betaine/proline transport system substrate-binding protein|uniref:ABC glycine betaine permease n=2 Tax=Acidocella TaxID=50709 RepID=A0A0D6PHL5_9PROT|nr:ABC glycine betaine permease [Acidocella aminolytica 101 = DSM 11237]GBQ34371.1 proline/glycine betaine ABC transporter substrate-binding periplasmic protein [Acidocella aminolytica 101 = DSM 11237]SHE31246.1 glycine betaine/proline transport system substrate-binding protein [Acidocella aminolytica 101 = DSM 11237]
MQRRHFIAGTALATSSLAMPALAETTPLRLTYVQAWPSSNLTTHIAAEIIKTRLNMPVELISTSAGPMWAAVAEGHADALLTAWLPYTHQIYWQRYKQKVIDLGQVTSGTWLGLAVPDYVTIDSLTQIEANHAKFHNKITGIEAGAGIMLNTGKAIKAYDMHDMHLLTSSTAAMQAQLTRAVERKEWIVVTAWKPLGIWSRFKLKTLEDPKDIYGKAGHIDTIINPSLQKRAPKVVSFLRDFKLPLEDIEAMMVKLNNGEALSQVTAGWIKAHSAEVAAWTA